MTRLRFGAQWTRIGLAAAVVSSIVLAGCGSNPSSGGAKASANGGKPETTSLTVGVTPVGDFAPIYYAVQQGIFKQYGLDVKIDPKGASEVPPLVANSYQVVTMSWTTYVQALAQGIELRAVDPGIVGQPDTQTGIYAMGSSPIKTPQDLVGHTLGINQPKATFELNSRVALDGAGVDPNKVNFQVLPLSTMVDALAGGKVDSAYLVPPFSTQAEARGAHLVQDAYKDKQLAGTPVAGYVVTKKFADANPNTVAAFQKAMAEAATALNDPAKYRSFIPTYTQLTPELAQQIPAYQFSTAVDVAGLQRVADLMAQYKFATRKVDIKPTVITPAEK